MADLKSKFLKVYSVLKSELLEDPAFDFTNDSRQWVERENYGKPDPENVAKVKALYKELDIEGVFADYESKSHKKLTSWIEGHPSKAVQAVLKSFLGKIYKRQK
ncbi:hypothetical protein C1H46_022208 [Malus baccata]|uniref:Uncharacterized protein n=1 Tax=Malus baccata TaxID=106549 RepID=A0A540M0K7_MALBA|nr:hypothetical protein C1H46_022208 [Malus baccata]